MKLLIASTALGLMLAAGAQAQEAAPEATEPEVGGAVGLATGAVGETFFVRAPAEYHLLTSEMPGLPVFLDTTQTGMQRASPVDAEEAAGTVDADIRAGEAPVGEITDVLIDRRGGSAGLVVELNPDMRGGAREVAVAMGLVRMLPGHEDPRETIILLTLDPVDLENAPSFERPGEAEAETQPQDVAPGEAEEGAAQQQPSEDATAEPADQPADQPTEEATGAPADTPADAPAEDTAAEGTEDAPAQPEQ